MPTADRVEHVERPCLPWRREAALTECGLPVAGHPVISRAEFEANVRRQGKKRTAMTTCMTCFETAARWPTWEQDPPQALARECQWGRTYRTRDGTPIENELRALAELVERHRTEFDALLDGFKGVTRLDDRRHRHPA